MMADSNTEEEEEEGDEVDGVMPLELFSMKQQQRHQRLVQDDLHLLDVGQPTRTAARVRYMFPDGGGGVSVSYSRVGINPFVPHIVASFFVQDLF